MKCFIFASFQTIVISSYANFAISNLKKSSLLDNASLATTVVSQLLNIIFIQLARQAALEA